MESGEREVKKHPRIYRYKDEITGRYGKKYRLDHQGKWKLIKKEESDDTK